MPISITFPTNKYLAEVWAAACSTQWNKKGLILWSTTIWNSFIFSCCGLLEKSDRKRERILWALSVSVFFKIKRLFFKPFNAHFGPVIDFSLLFLVYKWIFDLDIGILELWYWWTQSHSVDKTRDSSYAMQTASSSPGKLMVKLKTKPYLI